MSVRQMSVRQMSVRQMSVRQMSVRQMSVDICLLYKCLLDKCPMEKYLSAKCLSVKCLFAKCQLVRYLLSKCLSDKRLCLANVCRANVCWPNGFLLIVVEPKLINDFLYKWAFTLFYQSFSFMLINRKLFCNCKRNSKVKSCSCILTLPGLEPPILGLWVKQGRLTEGDGSVQLTSSLG